MMTVFVHLSDLHFPAADPAQCDALIAAVQDAATAFHLVALEVGAATVTEMIWDGTRDKAARATRHPLPRP